MKIFCVDVSGCEPQFYSKSETAQIRNNEPLYIPFFCKELRYEFAFAVKINRVTKAINEKFASRCWSEFSVVTNFWSEDLTQKQRLIGAPLDIAYTFDRSFALENDFHVAELLQENNIIASACVNGVEIEQLSWSSVAQRVNEVIAYISTYVTLKIGDVIMFKQVDAASRLAVIGDRIEIKIKEEIIVETIIK